MSAPHFYLDHFEAAADDAVEKVDVSADDDSSFAYAGLSPFDIPIGVDVEIENDSDCLFRFAYSNAEPGEDRYREASRDGRLLVRLGRNTGKVLEVLAKDAKAGLENESLDIDLALVPAWQMSFPWQARETCRRSAYLIGRMLQTIPDEFRLQLVNAL